MVLPRRIHNINMMNRNSTAIDLFTTQDLFVDNYRARNRVQSLQQPMSNQTKKTFRALSCNPEKLQLSSKKSISGNENRLRNFYTQLKRRFSGTKESRANSEDSGKSLSKLFKGYQSISSSNYDSNRDFDWPDFEKVYDSIPMCLTKGLPGVDDQSNEDERGLNTMDTANSIDDEHNEQCDLYQACDRGPNFRRNAICHKLDKSQYNSQLNVFLQQLMIEKLIRTWA